MQFQPFWFDQVITEADIHAASVSALSQPIDTDVCIVGGGFTGLWTAIELKKNQPELDVTVIEKDLCGQGASGRNGGCMLTWSTKFSSLIHEFGLEQACFLVNESEQAVHAIKAFTQQYQIDCDCRIDGTYYTASNPSQQTIFAPILALLEQHQLNSWRAVQADNMERTGSSANLSAIYSPHAGSVQPAKLVRGLMRVAKMLGVRICEKTQYLAHTGKETLHIKTPTASIRANKLIFSVNAWLPQLLKQFSRKVILVSSDMAISHAMPAQLNDMGLNHGAPVIDGRTFVNYYRTTSDGRLMLGKGGNYFSFANRVNKKFDQASHYQGILQRSLRYFFNQHPVEIARTWTGPSDRSVSGFPFFGHLEGQNNVLYGSGYSGNGVVQSYLGGQILASLALNKRDKWRTCALVNQSLKQFPAEPFRSTGAILIRNAIRRKEDAEDARSTPARLDLWLSRFSGSAAKVDPNLKVQP